MSWEAFPDRRGVVGRTSARIRVSKIGDATVCVGADAEARGWRQGERIRLERGSGEHAGWLRLTRSEQGFVLNSSRGTDRGLRVVTRRLTAPGPIKTVAVETRWDGEALLMRLPWADGGAPAAPPRTESAPPPEGSAGAVLDRAVCALRRAGKTVEPGATPGVWLIDGTRISATTLVDDFERRAGRPVRPGETR